MEEVQLRPGQLSERGGDWGDSRWLHREDKANELKGQCPKSVSGDHPDCCNARLESNA